MTDISLDTALKVGEIVAIVGSAATALIMFSRVFTRVEVKLENQTKDIVDLKLDVKKLSEVITTVATQGVRMDALSERMTSTDRRYDTLFKLYEEIRRGTGWITKKRDAVDGEYEGQ